MARLTIDIDSELHDRLKILVARKRTTMRRYWIEALEARLATESPEPLSAEQAPVLAELWDNPEDAIYDEA